MFERLSTFEESIAQSADFICDERVSRLATELLEHPDDYPRFHEIRSTVKQAELALRAALGDRQHLLTCLLEAINLRDGVEYEYIYKLGFLDGGRVYHGFVSHELLHSLLATKEESP